MLKFSRNAFQKNTPLAWSRKGSKYTLRNWLLSEANRKTRISIRHVGIYGQVQSSIDRTAVPLSPRQSTTKVALVKATKHKPNLATDEVRVENRNHGLAWSQSGQVTSPLFLNYGLEMSVTDTSQKEVVYWTNLKRVILLWPTRGSTSEICLQERKLHLISHHFAKVPFQ